VTSVPRYSRDQGARRGGEIFEREVLPRLGPEDEGKFALIDVETGDYEIDRDEITASDRLLAGTRTLRSGSARCAPGMPVASDPASRRRRRVCRCMGR